MPGLPAPSLPAKRASLAPTAIPLHAVRRLMLRAQGLDHGWRLPERKAGTLEAVRRLGAVQIDTIAVVMRAHHHVLWTRQSDYQPAMLDELQSPDRAVFEHWCPYHIYNAAAYIPIDDYRCCVPRMRARAALPWIRQYLRANRTLAADILRRIRAEGPLSASDFESPPGFKRGTWWHRKPAKHVLEMLFDTGRLMVSHRKHFRRYYDLTERILPTNIDTRPPGQRQLAAALLRQSLRAYGFASLRRSSPKYRVALLAAAHELVDADEAVWMTCTEAEGLGNLLVHAEALETVDRKIGADPVVHILSPFDPLILWRAATLAVFGFDYRLECYTPAAKRRYGYFCLPILYGERLVARIDCTADRAAAVLRVHTLHFESDTAPADGLLEKLAAKLRQFAIANGCREIAVGNTSPARRLRELRGLLKHD